MVKRKTSLFDPWLSKPTMRFWLSIATPDTSKPVDRGTMPDVPKLGSKLPNALKREIVVLPLPVEATATILPL